MGGYKKISRVFQDHKIPGFISDSAHILEYEREIIGIFFKRNSWLRYLIERGKINKKELVYCADAEFDPEAEFQNNIEIHHQKLIDSC